MHSDASEDERCSESGGDARELARDLETDA